MKRRVSMVSLRERLVAEKALRIVSRRPPRSFWVVTLITNEFKLGWNHGKTSRPFRDARFIFIKRMNKSIFIKTKRKG